MRYVDVPRKKMLDIVGRTEDGRTAKTRQYSKALCRRIRIAIGPLSALMMG